MIARYRPLLMIALMVFVVGALAWLWSPSLVLPNFTHEQARELWPSLVQKGIDEDPRLVERAFEACFTIGAPVADYETLLESARKQIIDKDGALTTIYEWRYNGESPDGGSWLTVEVAGDPPVIKDRRSIKYIY